MGIDFSSHPRHVAGSRARAPPQGNQIDSGGSAGPVRGQVGRSI